MKLVALTGGIAAGKSTIGRRFEELGAIRIDADQLAREAVAVGSPGLAQVRTRFGDRVLSATGELDRPALGAIVFGDETALADLNAIVHPEVRRLLEERIAEARERDPAATVVYEVPLLVETGATEGWDLVLTAEAPVETRVARMRELRGMSEQDARARVSNQAGDAARRAIADEVIDTGGTEAQTVEQVDRVWNELLARGER